MTSSHQAQNNDQGGSVGMAQSYSSSSYSGSYVSSPTIFEVGDRVSAIVTGTRYEGTLRYLGKVHFKQGEWAGIELSKDFAGQGKNNGEVKG